MHDLEGQAREWSHVDQSVLAKYRETTLSEMNIARERLAKHPMNWSLPHDVCGRLRNLGFDTSDPRSNVGDGAIGNHMCEGTDDKRFARVEVWATESSRVAEDLLGSGQGFREGEIAVKVVVVNREAGEDLLWHLAPSGVDLATLTQGSVGVNLASRSISLSECESFNVNYGEVWSCEMVRGGIVVGAISGSGDSMLDVRPVRRWAVHGVVGVTDGRHSLSIQIPDHTRAQELADAIQTLTAMGPALSL